MLLLRIFLVILLADYLTIASADAVAVAAALVDEAVARSSSDGTTLTAIESTSASANSIKLSLLKQINSKRNNKIAYECGDDYLNRHCECKLEPILNTLHMNCNLFLPVNYTVVPKVASRRTNLITRDETEANSSKPINGIYIRNAYSSWPLIESVYENIYFLSITNSNLTGELGAYSIDQQHQNTSIASTNTFKNLIKLILNNNNLSRINRTYFCSLVSLEHLDLSFNKFEVIDFEDFICLDNDNRVDVEETENDSGFNEHDLNELNKRSGPSTSNIFRLKRIYLNNNRIKQINSADLMFVYLLRIQIVDFSNNQLSSLTVELNRLSSYKLVDLMSIYLTSSEKRELIKETSNLSDAFVGNSLFSPKYKFSFANNNLTDLELNVHHYFNKNLLDYLEGRLKSPKSNRNKKSQRFRLIKSISHELLKKVTSINLEQNQLDCSIHQFESLSQLMTLYTSFKNLRNHSSALALYSSKKHLLELSAVKVDDKELLDSELVNSYTCSVDAQLGSIIGESAPYDEPIDGTKSPSSSSAASTPIHYLRIFLSANSEKLATLVEKLEAKEQKSRGKDESGFKVELGDLNSTLSEDQLALNETNYFYFNNKVFLGEPGASSRPSPSPLSFVLLLICIVV